MLHDAESLALLRDGSFVVGFEREHRFLRYPAGTGRPDVSDDNFNAAQRQRRLLLKFALRR